MTENPTPRDVNTLLDRIFTAVDPELAAAQPVGVKAGDGFAVGPGQLAWQGTGSGGDFRC